MKADQASFIELSRELLGRGALLRFRAYGSSMHPFIRNGDILTIEPLKEKSPSVGDIIFYRGTDNTLTAHRLIKIENTDGNTILITKGDSHRYTDTPFKAEQVIGRVVRIENQRKKLSLMKWPAGILDRFMAGLARGCYPNQERIIRNLGRVLWLIGGRRLK